MICSSRLHARIKPRSHYTKKRKTYAAEQVIEIYRTSDSGEEKRHCLSAIGKAKDPTLLSEAMDFILDSGEVRLCVYAYTHKDLNCFFPCGVRAQEYVFKVTTSGSVVNRGLCLPRVLLSCGVLGVPRLLVFVLGHHDLACHKSSVLA